MTVFSFSTCSSPHFYDFFSFLTSHIEKFIYSPKIKNLYDDTQYRRCQLFLPIPIRPTTDCSNNRPDYTYGRCIGTALHVDSKRPIRSHFLEGEVSHGG